MIVQALEQPKNLQVAPHTNHSSPTFKNAAKILTNVVESRPYLKYVQVKDKTANFSNGHMLLRRYCDAPDGLYTVGMDGGLTPASVPPKYFFQFPNFDVVRPPFEKMVPLCDVASIRGDLIRLCEVVRQREGSVIIDKDSVWMVQDSQTGIAFPFNMPYPARLDPRYLQISLIEMLQYPYIYMLREIKKEDGSDQQTPIILGVDWGSCAVIMPQRMTQYG